MAVGDICVRMCVGRSPTHLGIAGQTIHVGNRGKLWPEPGPGAVGSARRPPRRSHARCRSQDLDQASMDPARDTVVSKLYKGLGGATDKAAYYDEEDQLLIKSEM